jgi:hypothetical protein
MNYVKVLEIQEKKKKLIQQVTMDGWRHAVNIALTPLGRHFRA